MNQLQLHFPCLPATFAILSDSWLFAALERLVLRCLPPPDAERMLRRCTSVALKKATMKGCLFWGPLRPISPATRGLILSPVEGDRESSATGAIMNSSWCAMNALWAIFVTRFQFSYPFFSAELLRTNVLKPKSLMCSYLSCSHAEECVCDQCLVNRALWSTLATRRLRHLSVHAHP